VSGTARLSQALLVFLTIIFGVAAGGRLVTLVMGAGPQALTPIGLPAGRSGRCSRSRPYPLRSCSRWSGAIFPG
jgi:hypothetical protein